MFGEAFINASSAPGHLHLKKLSKDNGPLEPYRVSDFSWITWRIIPLSKWLIAMVSKSPNWGCSPSKWPKWLINRGYELLTKWDDPPSTLPETNSKRP